MPNRAARTARGSNAGNHTLLRLSSRQSTTGCGCAVLPPMMTILAQLLTSPMKRRIFLPSAGTSGTKYAPSSVAEAIVAVIQPRLRRSRPSCGHKKARAIRPSSESNEVRPTKSSAHYRRDRRHPTVLHQAGNHEDFAFSIGAPDFFQPEMPGAKCFTLV